MSITDLKAIHDKCRELEAMLNAIPHTTGNMLFEAHISDLLSECRQMAIVITDSLSKIDSDEPKRLTE